jgi:diguanylate cyclase (GGDEF)-like protein/PAS domain S-box-containing protein
LILVGGFASALWVMACWALLDRVERGRIEAAISRESTEAGRLAAGVAAGLEREVRLRAGVADVFAQDQLVQRVLTQVNRGGAAWHAGRDRRVQRPADSALGRLDRYIAVAKERLALDALWVGDAAGFGIACPEPAKADSPVGVRYDDRLYFRAAASGHSGYQYAYGRTTNVGGLFFSAPVHVAGRFAGFTVAKLNVDALYEWFRQVDALLVDANGVVILASNRAYELRALPDAGVFRMSPEERLSQYGRTEFLPLQLASRRDARYPVLQMMGNGDEPVTVRSISMPGLALTVSVYRAVPEIAAIEAEHRLLLPLASGVGVLLVAVVGTLFGYLQHVHSSRHQLARQKQQLDDAQRLAMLGSWELDSASSVVTLSDETRRMFCFDGATSQTSFDQFLRSVHDEDRDRVLAAYRDSLAGDGAGEIVHRIVLPGHRIKYLHQRWHSDTDESTQRKCTRGFVQDITASHEAASRLRLAASVVECANEGICITDAQSRIVEVNPALCTLTGYGRDDLIGHTPRLFKSGRHDADFYQMMWQALRDKGHWYGELWNRRADGGSYAVRLAVSAVTDAAGRVTHYVGTMADITPAKLYEAQLENIAHFDVLTHVPNRLLLADRLRQAIAQAERTRAFVAVCYLDLDGFKPINDTHGHDAGDKVLVEIAQRLAACLRGGDTVARLGGDEFVLVLGLAALEDLATATTRMIEEVARPMTVAGRTVSISASVGVSIYPRDGLESDALLRHADEAMCRAKRAGKNRVEDYAHDAAVEISAAEDAAREAGAES